MPPEFVTAIVMTEKSLPNPVNSFFAGLEDSPYPEENIRAGIEHIHWLMEQLHYCTWFSVAIGYYAGLSRVWDPPWPSIIYANEVVLKMHELSGEGMYFDPRVNAYDRPPFRIPTERLASDFVDLFR